MIYYYNIKVRYYKGDKPIQVDYMVSFCNIGKFFCNLEKKHGDNYCVISIKERKRYNYLRTNNKKEDN